MSRVNRWIELLGEVGQAALEVLAAELGMLGTELGRSGKAYLRVLILFGAVGAILFWTVGVFVFFAVALVALWLPMWGAALSVGAALALVALVLALWGRYRLRRIENPQAILERRYEQHQSWLKGSVLEAEHGETGQEGTR